MITDSSISYNPDVSIADAPFYAPFSDAGAGAVKTTLLNGTGSPTFTRASVAWTKLSTGLWAQVATGIARATYLGQDTTVGAYGGFLCEAAGTQLVTPTASIRDMTDASWIKVTMTTAKTATGIDGAANSATTITATGATATILQTLTAGASSRTYSCFIKRRTGSGTIIIQQGATTLDVTSQINASTYTLVQLNASVLNSAFGIKINTSGDALDVDFNQFEAGAFATSPIDTAGASRAADVLTYPTASNFSDTAGTMYAETQQTSWANVAGSIIGSATQGLMPLATQSGVKGYDGTNTVNGATGSPSGVVNMTASWTGSSMSVVSSGTAVTNGSYDGTWNLASIGIGTSGNGIIRNVKIWATALSDTDLQKITRYGNSVQVTSGAASAIVPIPNTADGKKARYILLICPSGYLYVKPVVTSGSATVNDLPIVSTGSTQIILAVRQYTHLAYIQGSSAEKLNIIPLEY